MTRIRLGCSTITWRRQAPMEQMLAEIAAVGYEGVPAGYREGERPEAVREQLARYGLVPAPGYLGARYHDPAERETILELARRHADWTIATGCRELFVAESCFAERFAVAGHETANRADQLSEEGYRVMADTLDEVGRICRAAGVQACFHNHAGSYVETRDEFDRLLALTDPELVAIGLDTGHLRYGGGDVTDFARSYARRIKILHLKDIHEPVLEEGRRRKQDYHTMQANGLWAEPGRGCVDFAALFRELRAVGFAGWAIAEVDQTSLATPRDSIEASFAHLKSLGL